MRGKGVAKQARTVVNLPTCGGLLTKLAGGIRVLCVNARFRPVNSRIGIQPVIIRRGYRVGQLGIALDRRTVGHWIAAVSVTGLRVFRFPCVVVVIAQ